MNDPADPSSPVASAAGQRLRQAREHTGLHVAALAATLKVPVRHIEALEAGRYHDLPDATFARALTASICRLLKVDPEPCLAALPLPRLAPLGESSFGSKPPITAKASDAVVRPGLAPASGMGGTAALALGLVLLALALWFLLPQRSPAPELPPPPLVSAAPESETSPLPTAPAPSPVPDAPLAATPPLAPPSATAEAAPPPLLQLSAQQTAWIQVTGASGRVWLQRSLQPGESVAFDADWPLQLVVGRVDAVQASLQGQALDLAPYSRNNVARLQVRPTL